SVLDLKLSPTELNQGKQDLLKVTKNDSRKTIAFFTFAIGAKCYSFEWWNDCYVKFYPKYSIEYNLIEILPVEDISTLARKMHIYYSKDVREIASLMANCELVVASDSGMMHLSSAALTPTIGLFSVTRTEVYAPYGNGSTFVDTEKQSQNDIIKAIDKILLND